MSRRSRKKMRRQRQGAGPKPPGNDTPVRNDAMEQALRAALEGQGEEGPDRPSRSFGAAVQDVGRRLFRGRQDRASAPGSPMPRGANTQFLRRTGEGDVELVIGLDFGTSCTKVVIQDIARQTAYAVPFAAEIGSTGSYLLSTSVHLDDKGVFNLAGPGTQFRGLKEHLMSLAGNDLADDADKRKDLLPQIYAYIALVFREVRAWFMEEHEDTYRGREILWRVNVGLPASRYDQQHMPELYKSTIRRAWFLSTQPAPVSANLAQAVRQLGQVPEDRPDALSRSSVEAFPEVVAAVQGYAKSPQRGDGLYLLVDVGATTLDVTCFCLLNYANEEKFPMFCASVRPLGGFELFKYRTKCVEALVGQELDRYNEVLDGTKEPPDPLEISVAVDEHTRGRIDGEFRNRVGKTIGSVISETKKRGDPTAKEWQSQLPVFLIGGAAGMEIYREALSLIDNNPAWNFRLAYKALNLPQNVEARGTGPAIQQRLIVAYGLSFSQFDFATLIPPSGIPDPEPVQGSPRPEIPDFSKEAVQ